MIALIRTRLSVPNVLATLALFGVLGGTSYAASQLPSSSVGSGQLRNGAVTSTKVRNGSLLGADFRSSQHGAAGARGAAGVKGPRGDKGATGSLSVVVRTLGPGTALVAGQSAGVAQGCLAGERAVGGGASATPLGGEATQQSHPTAASAPAADGKPADGWSTQVKNAGTTPVTPTGYVLCAH